MERKAPDALGREPVAKLESRIAACPQHVVEYLRLARHLEETGDLARAASVLQTAQFFLPNSPQIIEGLQRLSEWVDSTRAPIMISRPEAVVSHAIEEEVQEVPPTPETVEADELDQLIEGLQHGRPGRSAETVTTHEQEWAVDDGLLVTETLAQIYVAQNQFKEAMLMYGRLAEMESDPERAATLREKAADLRTRLRDSND